MCFHSAGERESSGPEIGTRSHSDFALPASVIPQLRRLFRRLSSSTLRESRVRIAVRRFGDSHHRVNQEDQLLDLVIALEALYGGERDQAGDVALRAAHRLQDEYDSKAEPYEVVRRAYKGRNNVVHANRRSHGVKASIQLAIDQLLGTSEVVTRAIRRELLGRERGDVDALDWNRIVLN